MVPNRQRTEDQAAYRRMKPAIDQQYALGRFIAIEGEEVVANAESFDELRAVLRAMSKDPRDTLVVQAGVDYPESAIIFGQGSML